MEKINYRYRTVKVILSTFKDRKDIWYNNHISYIINGNYYEITVSNLVIFPEELGMAIHRNLYNTIDVMEINQNVFATDSRKYMLPSFYNCISFGKLLFGVPFYKIFFTPRSFYEYIKNIKNTML